MNRHTSDVYAFEAHAPDADLDDLRARLAAARLPEAETVRRTAPDPRRWDQGVPLADLVDVVNYWRTGYNWRSFETRLNQIGQFRTTIDDLGIHFLHRRSTRADATPLLLTHGWPGSVAEFTHVMDELADPKTQTHRRSTSWPRRCQALDTATSRPPPGGEPKRSRPPG
jgi:hypothetical protein